MKKTLILLAIIALTLPSLVLAQDNLTQTYDDGSLSFKYPAEWVLTIDEEDASIDVSNVELGEDEDGILNVVPGHLLVSIVIGSQIQTLMAFPTDSGNTTFMAGYMMGFAGFGLSFFAEEPLQVEFGPVEETTFNDREVTVASLRSNDTDVLTIIVDFEGEPIIVIAGTGPGELEQWYDTILAIAGTIEYTP